MDKARGRRVKTRADKQTQHGGKTNKTKHLMKIVAMHYVIIIAFVLSAFVVIYDGYTG